MSESFTSSQKRMVKDGREETDRTAVIGYLAARGTVREKKYFTKKLGVFCMLCFPILILVAVPIIWGPVLLALARHVVNVSRVQLDVLHIDVSSNSTSIPTILQGSIRKTGIFPAKAFFRQPVELYWMTPTLQEVKVASMELGPIGVTSAGHGTISMATVLDNVNEDAVAQLGSFLATNSEVTVKVNCSEVHLVALGFLPAWQNIAISKHVVLKGLDNLKGIKLLDFDIPNDDPQGGATVDVVASMNNPSALDIGLDGDTLLSIYDKDVFLGMTTIHSFQIHPGNNMVQTAGRLVLQTNQHGLETLSAIVDKLLANIPAFVNVKIEVADRQPKWLHTVVDALNVTVAVVLPEPLRPLKSISILDLTAMINAEEPWQAQLSDSERSISAYVEVPFGLSMEVVDIQVEADVNVVNETAGRINGVSVNASSSLDLLRTGVRGGAAWVSLSNESKIISANQEKYADFLSTVALGCLNDPAKFTISGSASATVKSSLGLLRVSKLPIDVGTSVAGLGLHEAVPELVGQIDVRGASINGINVGANVSIHNPSNVTVVLMGNVRIPFASEEIELGTCTIGNISIAPGDNVLPASVVAKFGNEGTSFLNNYLANATSTINVANGTSDISSLQKTMSLLVYTVNIPGIGTAILPAAEIQITDTTAVSDDIVLVQPLLHNPYSADIDVQGIRATASLSDIQIGNVSQPTGLQVRLPGHDAQKVQNIIPANVDFYPPDILAVFRALVLESGQDTAPLEYLLSAGEVHLTGGLSKRDDSTNLFQGFNLSQYTFAALQSARAKVDASVQVTINDYALPLLAYSPSEGVPLHFDNTYEKLFNPIGVPIAQRIIDKVNIDVQSVIVTSIAAQSIKAIISATANNFGALTARVSFPDAIELYFEGQLVGAVAFPTVSIQPYQTEITVQSEIRFSDAITSFSTSLLALPGVALTFKASNMVIEAFGITLIGNSLTKTIMLAGFDGLKGMISLDSFDLPSSDDQGITLIANASVKNPSQVGLSLGSLSVGYGSQGVRLGQIGLVQGQSVSLAPLGVSKIQVSGHLTHQDDGTSGLVVLNDVVNRFLDMQTNVITATGLQAGPPEATWLQDTIKTLNVDVNLDSRPLDNIVNKIRITEGLAIAFAQEQGVVLQSVKAQADINLPYLFPLQVQHLDQQTTLEPLYKGQGAGQISLVGAEIATSMLSARSVIVDLINTGLHFDDEQLSVFANNLVPDALLDSTISLGIHGNASATVSTAAGNLDIRSLSFALDPAFDLTSLRALNSMPPRASSIDVISGTKSYVQAKATAMVYNPSSITASVGGAIILDILFGRHPIGQAVINDVNLVPGNNTVNVTVQLKLNNDAGRDLVQRYSTGEADMQIGATGSSSSTRNKLLEPALAKFNLEAAIPVLAENLVTGARLLVPEDVNGKLAVQATFDLKNPFTAPISAKHAVASVKSTSQFVLANVDTKISITAPGKSTVTSTTFDVTLTQDIAGLVTFFIGQAEITSTSIAPLLPLLHTLQAKGSLASTVEFSWGGNADCPSSPTTFDVLGQVVKVLQSINVSVDAMADATVGDYSIDKVAITQNNIPIAVDNTVQRLIGPFAAPIVESIAAAVSVSVHSIKASRLTSSNIDIQVTISITGVGPFAARIEAEDMFDLMYNDKRVAQLELPPFCFTGDNVALTLPLRLAVTDQNAFSDLVNDIVHQPEVTLAVQSKSLRAIAYGFTFSKISVNTRFTISGLSGIPGVTVPTVDVTGETSNSLTVLADAQVPISAPLSVDLPSLTFAFAYEQQTLGIADVGLVSLSANAVTPIVAKGIVSHLDSSAQTTALSHIASRFIAGKTTTGVMVHGLKARDDKGKEIPWLSKAIASLGLAVDIPGKQNLSIVRSIGVPDLIADLRGEPSALSYAFPLSSNTTDASYSVPFPITIQPLTASGDVTVVRNGVASAMVSLSSIPLHASSAKAGDGIITPLSLSLDRALLERSNENTLAYDQLIAAAVSESLLELSIQGSVHATAKLSIGTLPIDGVPIDMIPISLTALDGLLEKGSVQGKPRVVAGNPEYITAEVNVTLHNPSQITAFISSQIRLPVFLNTTNGSIGKALISNAILNPGENTLPATFHVALQDPITPDETAQTLVRNLVQPVPHTIEPYYTGVQAKKGDDMSDIGGLQAGLEALDLSLVIEGIAVNLLQLINIEIDVLTLFAGPGGVPIVKINIDLLNDLPTPINIQSITFAAAKAGSDKTYASADHTFSPSITIPAAVDTKVDPGLINSGTVNGVVLPMGLLASIDILEQPIDVHVSKAVVALGGQDGYAVHAALDFYSVPATYAVTIGDSVLVNVTSLHDIADAIFGNLDKIPEDVIEGLLNGVSSLAQGDLLGLLNNGFSEVICAVPQSPLNLLSQADCSSSTNQVAATPSSFSSQDTSSTITSSSAVTSAPG